MATKIVLNYYCRENTTAIRQYYQYCDDSNSRYRWLKPVYWRYWCYEYYAGVRDGAD